MTQNTKVLLAGAAGLLVVAGAVLALGGGGGAGDGGGGAPGKIASPAEEATAPTESTVPTLQVPRQPFLQPQALASPEKALETQVRALMSKQESLFRGTLLPEAQAALTPEVFEACVNRVRTGPVNPEWGQPETTDGGDKVLRATVVGGAKVGFHESHGRWFADTVWCKQQLAPPSK